MTVEMDRTWRPPCKWPDLDPEMLNWVPEDWEGYVVLEATDDGGMRVVVKTVSEIVLPKDVLDEQAEVSGGMQDDLAKTVAGLFLGRVLFDMNESLAPELYGKVLQHLKGEGGAGS